MPTQLRGPIPNGMKAYWFGLISLSESHLFEIGQLKLLFNMLGLTTITYLD